MNLSIYLLSIYLWSIFNWFCPLVIFSLLTSSFSEFIPLREREISGPGDQRGTDLATFCGIVPLAGVIHLSNCLREGEGSLLTFRDIKTSHVRPLPGTCHLSMSQGGTEFWAQSKTEHFTKLLTVNRTSSESIFATFGACLVLSVELASLEEEWAYLGSLLFLG